MQVLLNTVAITLLTFMSMLSMASSNAFADCNEFFQDLKCPDESFISGPYQWTEQPNQNFKIMFKEGTCSDLYTSAGLNPLLEDCSSQVRVCANKRTAKLDGPMYVCNNHKQIVLEFKDGKLDGHYTVFSSNHTVVKQGQYASGIAVQSKGRSISSVPATKKPTSPAPEAEKK